MAGFLRLLVMPAVPAYVLLTARRALPGVRRLTSLGPVSRYHFAVPDVTFLPRDLRR